ncbi:MAG: site-specific integrase [Nitrosopumilus sp.]|nr:site-specific integrase [Nitrosopumilus sp.]
MSKPRCEIIFEQSIRSEATRENYLRCMKKFMQFVGVDNLEELLQGDQKAIQEKVEDYVIHLKGRVSPNSFGVQLAPIFLFYALNDVVLNKTKIKKMCPSKIKVGGFNAYSRTDIQFMLDNTRKKRTKAIVMIFSSTGCRVGGLIGLKVGDILDVEKNAQSKCLRFYTNEKEEYYGFLTPEATRMVYEYLEERQNNGERITDDSPVISLYENYGHNIRRVSKNATRLAVSNSIQTIFRNHPKKRGMNGRYLIPTTHGFRKYFNRTMKMREGVNLSVCEKLLGHSTTIKLDNSYLPVSKDELFLEFEKAIPELTIRADERHALRIADLEKEKQSHEDKTIQNKLLQEELEVVKLKIERIENSKNV